LRPWRNDASYLSFKVLRQVSENLLPELAKQLLIVSGESPPHTLFISSWHLCAVSQKAWHTGDSFERFSSTQLNMESGVRRHGRKQSDRISAPHVSLTPGEGVAPIATCDDIKTIAAKTNVGGHNRRVSANPLRPEPEPGSVSFEEPMSGVVTAAIWLASSCVICIVPESSPSSNPANATTIRKRQICFRRSGAPVWWFGNPLHSCRTPIKRISEPNHIKIISLLVSFESEVRSRASRRMKRTSDSKDTS
jgi:hypothetical protein